MKRKLHSFRLGRRAAALLLTLCMLLPLMPTVAFAEGEIQYIYLDLALGSITFSASNYTYYVRENNQNVQKTGTHAASNRYYIFQSSGSFETAPVENYVDIPDELLINETDVAKVKTNWQTYATTATEGKIERTFTNNTVKIQGNSTFDIVLDNIWTNYEASGNNRTTAGIMIPTTGFTNVTLRLKGDNRVGNIYYPSTSTNNSLKITSFEGDGATSGTLTAANYTDGAAYWTSAIGGNDGGSTQDARGIHIAGGTVYAGTTLKDNCTAIGGGGNGTGTVTISGGIVTAISFSTGTAIGGGIGFSSLGGIGNITITGGEIYAYNFGIGYEGTFVPGTAIGGGSSYEKKANPSTITIEGGTIYAESLGGSAIGAGNSVKQQGGDATVIISGGNITAKSISGTSAQNYSVPEGTAIGGGNSRDKEGGDATVTVSGGTIKANGVGGGFSVTNGYAMGKATVTGGSLNTELAATTTNASGERLYLTRVTVYLNSKPLENACLSSNENGTSPLKQFKSNEIIDLSYGTKDVYTDNVGVLYLWLPEDTNIAQATIQANDTEYTFDCEEADEKIDAKDIGALECFTPDDLCLLNITCSKFYELYYDADLLQEFNGTVVVTRNATFAYTVRVMEESEGVYYTLKTYYAKTDASGNKIMQPANELSDQEKHTVSMAITQDTQVWYSIIDSKDNETFALDLTNGNITVSQGEQGLIIDQNGYKISNFTGSLYLTSSGYPTSNTFTVNVNDETEVHVEINEINACSHDSVINVEKGKLHLSFGEADNMISSINGSAISVADGAELHLNFTEGSQESVKIDGAEGSPAIQGEGHVTVNDLGGYLKLNSTHTDENNTSILVGSYNYNGSRQSFNASLFDGIYQYKLIGYVRIDDDTDTQLHPIEEIINTSTTESFSARGILEAFNRVDWDTSQSQYLYLNENGDLVLKLKTTNNKNIGEIIIKNKNDTVLTNNEHYTVELSGTTATLTIKGSTFKTEGNLVIMAAAEGEINYKNNGDYEKTYDGETYTFEIEVADKTHFVVYYGKEELNEDNYSDKGQPTPFTFTNVKDSSTVYWYIDVINKDDEGKINGIVYSYVFGSNTVTINKATNKWIEKPTCPDILIIGGDKEQNTDPKPSAKAEFGEVIFNYYTEDKSPLDSTDKLPIGSYYVAAKVEGTENFMELEPYFIKFEVKATTVFTSNSRDLDKLTENTPISTPSNGAFTLYFSAKYEENMELRFISTDNESPTAIGAAKITMISFGTEGIRYYYYKLENGITTIPLKKFQQMGTTGETAPYTAPTVGENVEYQFCVDLAQENDQTTTFAVYLCGQAATEVNYKTQQPAQLVLRNDAYFKDLGTASGEKIATEVVGDTITVNLKPYANGACEKILAVIVTANNDQSSEKQVNLMLNSSASDTAENAITLQSAQGNLFIFSLGGSSSTVDGDYSLTIGNLESGKYKIECFIRLLENGLTDARYALGSTSAYDRVFTDSNTTIVASDPKLYVSLADDQSRVITNQTETLTFNVQHSGCKNENSECQLHATVYKKVNGSYVLPVALPAHTLTAHDGTEKSIIVDLSDVAQNMSVGTYRIVFELHGVTYNYNIIVAESTS